MIVEREIHEAVIRRKVQDAKFRQVVCRAYGYVCAVTGLRLVDPSGLAECQAAHIRSFAEDGPDVVQNGIALSSTAHWLFDRHLISINEDYALLVAPDAVPNELEVLLAAQRRRIILPPNQADWPAEPYMAFHRTRFREKSAGAS